MDDMDTDSVSQINVLSTNVDHRLYNFIRVFRMLLSAALRYQSLPECQLTMALNLYVVRGSYCALCAARAILLAPHKMAVN